MVLVTHRLQGSHVLLPLTSPTWTKGLAIKTPLTTVHFVAKREAKSLRVASFKGGIQNSEPGRIQSLRNNASLKLSYRSYDDENNANGSTKAQNTSLSYTSETEDSVTGKPAIQRLFKKWLTMLRTQSPIQVIEKASEVEQTVSETESEIPKTESLEKSTKNTVWSSWFWSLDASLKFPLLLFVPAFLAVSGIFGAEVTKELSPLWISGPLIVALYIKLFRGLCALYAFCFNQTMKLIRNLPSYYLVAYHYIIAHGKLRDDATRVIFAIKKTDYNELTGTRLKRLQVWMGERYLDFVESIWPYYCRTIRVLKRANLI